ncbi:Uma2 family endonuclease [soil metagenome]
MSTIEAKNTITPEQFLALPEADRFELIDGNLVERNVSVLSSLVENLVALRLTLFATNSQAGLVWGSSLGYQCFPQSPNKVRKPDVSFVRSDHFVASSLEDGFLHIRPDIVVEVVSPNDGKYEVDEKIEEYLSIGVPLVWIVNPETRIVEIHRPDGSVTKLHASEEITGEAVLPGFRCPVADFFPAIR